MSTVKGLDAAVAKINRIPEAVRAQVEEAIGKVTVIMLADMQALTPLDPENPGAHAREGLTVQFAEDGLSARVGLPTQELVSNFFWFRFLDLGTKGGEVSYWRRGADGKRTKHVMQVPARAALRIRERVLDGNREEGLRMITEAIRQGLAAA
jgi:hypothetical protein